MVQHIWYTLMKRIEKKKIEPGDTSQDTESSLTENEKFVKKLDIQIDIIKKIIDTGKIPSLFNLNDKSEMKEDL